MNISLMDESQICRFYNARQETSWVKINPGGVYSTDKNELLCTGLGSCISACIWDETKKIGGMNHFLLPFDGDSEVHEWHPEEWLSNATRYGCYAMECLVNELLKRGAGKGNLRLKLFGGARLLNVNSRIGEKNIEFILNYVHREHLTVTAQDLGGEYPRKVIFDPLTGRAWMKRLPYENAETLKRRENQYTASLISTLRHGEHPVELF